jgi:hypothetical protein
VRRFVHPILLALPILAALSLAACSDDDPVQPQRDPDYFPFVRNAVWTYRTNVFTDLVGPDAILQVKIDTVATPYGVHDYLKLRLPDFSDQWANALAMLDSAGVIYGIGEIPYEDHFPLFKHRYAESEITRETITVQGKNYQTVKFTLEIENAGSVSWWFADGVGLVREHSLDGLTLFSDNVDDQEVLTELVSYVK